MSKLFLIVCMSLLLTSGAGLAATPAGRITGGSDHIYPDWFKQSFLNFKEEAVEARLSGRHILVFMDLNNCPYCARTLEENFHQGDNVEYIRKYFDVIALNIRGSSEVTWIDQKTYTEQNLAGKLKVFATPTLVFIDPDGNQVMQLNGYRTPTTLRYALEYVHNKEYARQSLADYIEQKQQAPIYRFLDNPLFDKSTNFSAYQKPLAVIFEDKNCADCSGFHSKVLNHPDVLGELKSFRLVRLDAYSETPILDISGNRTTPKAWAAALGLSYRPGVVLFNEGKEAGRVEGRFYHFHFKEILRYVSGKYYKEFKSLGEYLSARQSNLLREGVNIDLGE